METVFWDFDGVILDSMSVRDYGFEKIFEDYNKEDVKKLLTYHRLNGGLSRYVKIRYFFNEILKKEISEDQVLEYAYRFSVIMRKELINPENLISETVDFIKKNSSKYNFHIVSGSDQEELRFLCKELNLSNFFLSINGSPTEKKVLVSNIISNNNYNTKTSCLIGDSINDYEAAKANNISFLGYNNEDLKELNETYIVSFKDLLSL